MIAKLRYKCNNGFRVLRYWVIPYLNSRIRSGEFRPILCDLFTEWKCNMDCYYCFQHDNAKAGMSLESAKSSIDWVKSLGCRFLSILGGEPLVRKDFVLEIIRYGRQNGLFMCVPTNGSLMDKAFIDEMGRARVSAVNLAVDCITPRKGLPKALLNIEPQFRYLVERQRKYGYLIFFNINICRTNIRDVKMLVEIGHQNRIGIDCHLNEPPHAFVRTDHYKHIDDSLNIDPDQYDEIEELLDWLIARHCHHLPMINSIRHLRALKDRMLGPIQPWDCRAGQNGVLIRCDETLSPCFDMITYEYDWGRIWEPRFGKEELQRLKEKCVALCSSTCYYNLGYYYDLRAFPEWVRKHIWLS